MIICKLIRVSTMTPLRAIAMRAISFVPTSRRGTIHRALHAEMRHSFQVSASRLRVDVVIWTGLIIAGFLVLPVTSPSAIADDPPPPPPTLGTLHVNGPCAGTGGYAVFDGDTFEGCSTGDLNFGGSSGGGSVGGGAVGGGGSPNEPNNNTSTTKPDKDKNPKCTNRSGDPIEVSQGSRTETLTLFSTPGEMGLAMQLFYVSPIGWSDTLSYWLHVRCGTLAKPIPCTSVVFNRPDGSTVAFSGTPGTVGNYPEVGGGGLATLTYSSNGTYTLHDENADTLVFSSGGQLESIIDPSGIGWTIANDSDGRPDKVTRTGGESFTLAYHLNTTTGDNPATTTVTITDPAGNVYQYNKHGLPGGTIFHGPYEVFSVTYPGSPATTITYKYTSSNTSIAELIETDINGVPYSYGTYDSNYEATGTRLADGSDAFSIVYAFPSGSEMTATVTNPLGHTTVDSYQFIDGQYLLTSVNDEAVSDCGATTHTAAYDTNGNLTKTVDNDGVTTTYSYAATGQLQTTTEAAGAAVARKTDYVWDQNLQLNRPLSVTVEGETKTSYTYNAQNRLASVTRTNLTGIGTANESLTTTYTYTSYGSGMVETMTTTQPSPNGTDHTTYAYDTNGNLTSVTDGLGHATTYSSYNGLGEVGKIVGPNGDETDYAYDARGRVASKTTHPNGTTSTWTYAYDGFGLLAQVSAPDGEVVTWTRDAEKRVKTITHNDKDGTSTETFTYDANNDVTSDVVARGSDVGKSTSYVYDALGRIYQIKGSHGQVRTYAYDGNGNVLSVTNALGYKTSYAYDALNRVASETNAAGGVTSFTYNAGDHVTHITDPRGLATGYAWDGLGQLWQVQSPDTGTTNYGYDTYGRLGSFIRADGTQTYLGYDALNRLTSKTAGGITRTYTWDTCTNGKGRLCAASNQGYDSIGYSYSPEGWVTGRSFTFSNGASYALGYAYDDVGQLAVVDYPDGDQALYDYTDGAVADVRLKVGGTSNVPGITNVTYRPMDMAMSGWTAYYNSPPDTITYDSDLRPTSITMAGVESLAFSYDAANRITQIDNGINGSYSQSLSYDALNRLTAMTSGAENESYQYDADGNRTYQVVNGQATSFAYATGSNRLASTSGVMNASYGYNADGDVATINGLAVYQYGPFHRLANAAGYAYENSAEGQRISKSGGGNTTYFALDPSGTLLAEDDNNNWMDYVWLNGRPVIVIVNGGVFPIHGDQTGRPLYVSHPNTHAMIWAAEGLPFTRTITTNKFWTFNIGFPGQYFDSESGLWHNGTRDYDASLGRYIESDPIGLAGGVNTYAYVGNNPISNVDALGLCNYCKYAHNAPSPQAYQALGEALKWGDILSLGSAVGGNLGMLTNFRHNGVLDPQRYGADANYANYAFGVEMSANGMPLEGALLAAQFVAESDGAEAAYALERLDPTQFNPAYVAPDQNYPGLPAGNVAAIEQGYSDQANGTLCTKN